MTREEIESLNVQTPYSFETDREEQWYQVGLIEGLEAADNDSNIDWLKFKMEATKDIVAALVSDLAVLSSKSDESLVSMAIHIVDEMIKQLKNDRRGL